MTLNLLDSLPITRQAQFMDVYLSTNNSFTCDFELDRKHVTEGGLKVKLIREWVSY